jgi:hypothetical protein
MSVVYALRAKLAGEAQEATWAARVAYEALDNFVINTEHIDTNKSGEEQHVLAHPLVQAELARQQRDLDELRGGMQDPALLIRRLRDRAQAEAAIFLAPLANLWAISGADRGPQRGSDERVFLAARSWQLADATRAVSSTGCPRAGLPLHCVKVVR